MNKTQTLLLLLVITAITITSCEYFGGGGRAYETEDGMRKMLGELNDEFGKGAGYTDISFSYHKDMGTAISATGTKDLTSSKLIEKLKLKGVWEDKSEITMEISGGAKSKDFMFTMAEVDLMKIPAIVKQSIDKVSKEKQIKEVVVNSVSISMPDELKNSTEKPTYHIIAEPKNGGTNFTLLYDEKGNFQKMIY